MQGGLCLKCPCIEWFVGLPGKKSKEESKDQEWIQSSTTHVKEVKIPTISLCLIMANKLYKYSDLLALSTTGTMVLQSFTSSTFNLNIKDIFELPLIPVFVQFADCVKNYLIYCYWLPY